MIAALAAAITIAAWVWAFARPVESTGGMFDFGVLERLAYCALALIVTLAVWLAYFAARVEGALA